MASLSIVIGTLLALGMDLHGAAADGGASPPAPVSIVDIGTLGGDHSAAYGINASGQVVGYAQTPDGGSHAVLWQRGVMTDLGWLPGASGSTVARAINDRGQIVGVSGNHAFLWQDGTMVDLGTLPGGRASSAKAINQSGQVIGEADALDGTTHAFLWQAGVMTDLGHLPSSSTNGVGVSMGTINSKSQIVGSSWVAFKTYHPFLWQLGTMTDLNAMLPSNAGWTLGNAFAINDAGQIVGNGTHNGGLRAFMLHDGTILDLGVLPGGGDFSDAHAISNRGQIVGQAGTPGQFACGAAMHAFSWQYGTMVDLNALPRTGSPLLLCTADAVNEIGQIVGAGSDAGHLPHGYVLTPAPTSSLRLDGSTGYAEAAASPDLNSVGDWTVEAWFKDDDPNGFNHPNRTIVSAGDPTTTAEVPYFVQVGENNIIAGLQAGGQRSVVTWDLPSLGASPKDWHHVAATFTAAQSVLNLWVDARHITYKVVPGHATLGTTSPLDIGRKGPTTGDYWQGMLDDVRIWSVVRSGADIAASYATQLGGPQPGLVANWHFDEGSDTLATDSTGAHHDATLNGGATFSTDVHP